MKILIISYHHNDSNSIGSVRSRIMSELLPKYGIEVNVLAAGYHDNDIIINGDIISIQSNEYVRNYYYLIKRKLRSFVSSKLIYLSKRSEWEERIENNLNSIIKYSKPDVVLCSYPPIFALRVGLLISKLYSIPLVTDFRDSFLVNPLETGLKSKISRKYFDYELIDSEIREKSKLILAASKDIGNSYSNQNSESSVKIIYNGFLDKKYSEAEKVYFKSDRFNIVHTGRISLSEKGTSILGLVAGIIIAYTRRPSISSHMVLHFIGKLSLLEKIYLSPLVCLRMVKLWGQVDRKVALSMQESSDALFLVTKPNSKNAISGKLIEYLRLKKPIIALTSGSEAEEILIRTKIGIIVAPDQSFKIAELFLNLEKKISAIHADHVEINKFCADEIIKLMAYHLKKL